MKLLMDGQIAVSLRLQTKLDFATVPTARISRISVMQLWRAKVLAFISPTFHVLVKRVA